jgi:hypothetical protein
MKILITGLLAFVMVLGMAPAAYASDHHNSVPFNGVGMGMFTITPTTVAIAGEARYTHLGMTTIAATDSITGVTSCAAFPVTTLKDVLTAANGDSVSLMIADVSCTPTANPSVFQVTASFSVVGGTGRFDDATGSGTIHATAALLSPTMGVWSETTMGRISF